jgi:surface antigen
MRKTVWWVFAAMGVACSSSEDVGRSAAAIDYICNEPAGATIDSIPAYPFCGDFNVWSNNGIDTKSASGGAGWVRTETNDGYQCAELALRYFRFKFGITTVWPGISYADQMCATHPAGMSVSNTPVHGDLMVFAGGSCGADATGGHVAVVDTVGAMTIDVVQQNSSTSTATYNTSCASCFLHADHNHGTDDPCEASTADGPICGQSLKLVSGVTDTLYVCANGVTTSQTACSTGCISEPANQADQCAPSDAGPDDAAAPAIDASPDAADAEAEAPDAAPNGNNGKSGGCATSPVHDGSRTAWVCVLAIALVARRRRKA